MNLTPQQIQQSLYGTLTIKSAKAQIDALDDTDALMLLRRITDLLIPIVDEEDAEVDPNPLHEAMAAFDEKELGLLVQYIASRPQFKSRTKSAKSKEMQVVEIPCAL
jgi:hypothetical protein